MASNEAVAENYRHGDLLQAILDSLARSGKALDALTVEDLAPVDEFHIGGRLATEHLLNQVQLSGRQQVLDVGCGLGGAARFVASRYHCQVTGIDLTAEYVETGRALCARLNLDRQVTLQHGSATDMPFGTASFDAGYMLHVGMNIADKDRLFGEVQRVLRPDSFFCVYDVMRTGPGELRYPVPWAAGPHLCELATPEDYLRALERAGFEVSTPRSRRAFALDFFHQVRASTPLDGAPPPLGLHTLMQDSTPTKIGHMIDNIDRNLIAPVEIIAYKR